MLGGYVPRNEQRDHGDQHEQPDEAARVRGEAQAADDADDQVVRDREQPPLHQHESAGQPRRVRNVNVAG